MIANIIVIQAQCGTNLSQSRFRSWTFAFGTKQTFGI